MNRFDQIYKDAAVATGRKEADLRAMAAQLFAVMLEHAMRLDGRNVYTATQILDGKLAVEVNCFLRDFRRNPAHVDTQELDELCAEMGRCAWEPGNLIPLGEPSWHPALKALAEWRATHKFPNPGEADSFDRLLAQMDGRLRYLCNS